MTPDELRRYSEMIVRGCIAFRRGDTLLVRAGLAHRDLAMGLTEAAYRAGAAAVEVEYDDPRVYAARIAYASKDALGRRTSWQRDRMRALGDEQVAIVGRVSGRVGPASHPSSATAHGRSEREPNP